MLENIEEQVRLDVEWLRLLAEVLGALMVAVGILIAIAGLVRHALSERGTGFIPIRLALARYLTLALEFQLAGRHPGHFSGTDLGAYR